MSCNCDNKSVMSKMDNMENRIINSVAQRIESYIDLAVNSQERNTGTSNNFTIYLNPNIPNIKKIELLSLTMVNNFYNVLSSFNNAISFTDPVNGIQTVLIPVGGYTINNLCTQIEEKISYK